MFKLTIKKLSILLVFFILLTKFWNYYLYYNNLIENNIVNTTFNKIKSVNLRVLSYNIFLLPNPFFF